MIQHFLEYIRTQLYFTADPKDEHFIENLAERSHNATGDVKALFNNIATIESKTHITEEELQNLHSEIQTFKSKYQWKTTT
jgi:peptidoglycan hydrolase CwlO-like protein